MRGNVSATPQKLDEVANPAVFMAYDKASGMTGTSVNLTMGSLDDWTRTSLCLEGCRLSAPSHRFAGRPRRRSEAAEAFRVTSSW